MVTPHTIVALAPMLAPRFTSVGGPHPYGVWRQRGFPYVGEYHGAGAENLIFQRYMAIYADIVLNLAAVADAYMGVHIDILPYIASGSDDGRTHNMAEMPDMRAFADACAFVDDAAGVDEAFQGGTPACYG